MFTGHRETMKHFMYKTYFGYHIPLKIYLLFEHHNEESYKGGLHFDFCF